MADWLDELRLVVGMIFVCVVLLVTLRFSWRTNQQKFGECMAYSILICLRISGAFLVSLLTFQALAQGDPCPVRPDNPVITGSAKSVCRGETVTLSATGCAGGTIIWSDNSTGQTLTVQPQRTVKYTALCRVPSGCVSCFAEVWKITVITSDAPVVVTSSPRIAPGESVTLTAQNCPGTVVWSNQSTGRMLITTLRQTTVFQAVCRTESCESNPAVPVQVEVAMPTKPTVLADKLVICAGQSVQLTAINCNGTVYWQNGQIGEIRVVNPLETGEYSADCVIGARRTNAEPITLSVNQTMTAPLVLATVTNGCPFQTADLTRAIQESPTAARLVGTWLFRTTSSPDSPPVQSPTAVLSGRYFLFLRDRNGCFSPAAEVNADVTSCVNGIAPCVSNPARVVAQLDSVNAQRGYVLLSGQLRGSATGAAWNSDGGGLFAQVTGLSTRYLFSETDRQRGTATFTLSTTDPDGDGPCQAATTTLTVRIPTITTGVDPAGPSPMPEAVREILGLSKRASEPTIAPNGDAEITYQFTVVNLGQSALTQVGVADNLDRAFTSAGAQIRSVAVKAEDGFVVNPAYTGTGADTTMLMAGQNTLVVGGKKSLWLTVRLNLQQATTLTFSNMAVSDALDAKGGRCRDISTNGADADPDKNGNPADNTEPTIVTLHSANPEAKEAVFVPEGFSPNNDGINDRFVIQGVAPGHTMRLEVFNRWGQAVYQSDDYKNDWDGVTSTTSKSGTPARQGLPDGTYFYVLKLSDGREFTRFLTLSR